MYLYKDDVMLSKQSNSESNEDSIKDDDSNKFFTKLLQFLILSNLLLANFVSLPDQKFSLKYVIPLSFLSIFKFSKNESLF